MNWNVEGSTGSPGYGPDGSGLNLGRAKTFFSSPRFPDWLWSPSNLLFNGYQGSFLTAKWEGRDANFSPPLSAKVKNEWSNNPVPPLRLHLTRGLQQTTKNVSLFNLFIGQEFSSESLHKRRGSTLSAMEFLKTGQCTLEFHNTQGTSCAVERLADLSQEFCTVEYSSCQSNGLKSTKPRG